MKERRRGTIIKLQVNKMVLNIGYLTAKINKASDEVLHQHMRSSQL